MEPSILWLIVGIALCAAEVMIGPGIGLFFGGLAAITVGVITQVGVVEQVDHVSQFAWFFALTVVWAVALWKPLKNFRSRTGNQSNGFNNIVGDTAVVAEGGLQKGREGHVTWSGTTMKAELAADAAESLPAGARATIVAVQGAKLIVK